MLRVLRVLLAFMSLNLRFPDTPSLLSLSDGSLQIPTHCDEEEDKGNLNKRLQQQENQMAMIQSIDVSTMERDNCIALWKETIA